MLCRPIILLICLLSPIKIFPCSCVPAGTFCEVVDASRSSERNDHMLLARAVVDGSMVIDEYHQGIVLEIIESFHNPRQLKRIVIQEGNGANCGRFLGDYEEGQELIFHTRMWTHRQDSFELGEFNICEPPPLRVTRGIVSGSIAPGLSELSLKDFRQLQGCGFSNLQVTIAPNPAVSRFQLQLEGVDGYELEIYDALGRRLQRQTVSKSTWVATEDWAEGLYYVRVSADGQVQTHRLLINR